VNWHVSIRAAAEADLRAAQEWYESQCPGLGGEFRLSVADALTRLEQSPELFPLYYRGFRRVLTRRFPDKLFYRVEGDAVMVFRMRHGARDHVHRLE
jgi:plasmid stabilization system protein ParE